MCFRCGTVAPCSPGEVHRGAKCHPSADGHHTEQISACSHRGACGAAQEGSTTHGYQGAARAGAATHGEQCLGSAVPLHVGAAAKNEREGEAGMKTNLLNDLLVFILTLDLFSSSFEEVE